MFGALCIAFDPHQDTPMDPLHDCLLGVAKYFWIEDVTGLNASQHI